MKNIIQNTFEFPRNTLPYSELVNTLKTGDIVLFSGQYPMSKLVEKLEGSKWSHVGMIVRLPEYDQPLLYEATALTNLPDLFSGETITGPKIVDLKQRLLTYGKDVEPYSPPLYGIRRTSACVTTEEVETIKNILINLHGIPNPNQNRMIIEVILGRYLHIKTTMKDITCSGFIAYTFKQLGWLKGCKPKNGFMPKDFSTDGSLSLHKITLDKEVSIEIDS